MQKGKPNDQELWEQSIKFASLYISKFGMSWDCRDDLRQEIAICLLAAREKFDPSKANWNTYSNIRARGAAIDFLRRLVPYEQRNLFIIDAPMKGDDDEDNSAFEIPVEDDLTGIEVEEILAMLKPRHRKVVKWLMLGYNQSEISRMLGVSEGIISRLMRGIENGFPSERLN